MHDFIQKRKNLMVIWKNQLIILKTGKYRLKNQAFILPLLYEMNLRVAK